MQQRCVLVPRLNNELSDSPCIVFIKESGVRSVGYLALWYHLLTRIPQCNKMTCPNCTTLSCYVCRKVITGYDHFNEVCHIFLCSFPSLIRVEHRRDLVSLNGQKMRANVYFGIKSRRGIRKRYIRLSFCLSSCSRCYQVEEAQKRAVAEYRKEHPEIGEDTLKVELPKGTAEASGSRDQRRRGRRVPLYERIEPLRPAQDLELERHRRLREAVHQHHVQDPAAGIEPALQLTNLFRRAHPAPENPEMQLPQPQSNFPRPARTDQNLQEAQGAPQQRGEDLRRHHEDNWVHMRRLAQQRRVLAGKFAGNNLRNPRPAALPDNPIHTMPRLQGNRVGGVRMDPVDRGRVDEWRRGVPGPEDDAAL